MRRISRGRRAEIQRSAQAVRQHGQRAGWDLARIADAVQAELPEVRPLEAWRLAYGWSRPRTIEGIAELYHQDGLAAPAVNSAMLCRWEHGQLTPSSEYSDALSRLYGVPESMLGLAEVPVRVLTRPHGQGWYGPAPIGTHSARREADGAAYAMTATGDSAAASLAAVRESVQLALEVEGPAGGSLAREQLELAVQYYDLNYSKFPLGLLAAEIHRCRSPVTAMLTQTQSSPTRAALRRLAGWLSGLLGNLAFHLADYPAAHIHLGTATRLGADVGDRRLVCWSLGAHSMVSRYQGRLTEALDFAQQALEHTTTPLTRAQILAWAELPALVRMGPQRRSEAHGVAADAQREMDTDPQGEQPGRFGFDRHELFMHLGEAHLISDDLDQATAYAGQSLSHTIVGRPGWAASTVILARAEAAHRRPDQAAELALTVLTTVPASSLREPARQRLASLDRDLAPLTGPPTPVPEFRERLRAVPPLVPVPRTSDEPNGR